MSSPIALTVPIGPVVFNDALVMLSVSIHLLSSCELGRKRLRAVTESSTPFKN